jgi:hypothetical protein
MFHVYVGEYLGYHIAVYACEMGELGDVYLGYYKIFSERPRSFWDHGEVVANYGHGHCSTPECAMEHAETLAKQKIRQLPSRRGAGVPIPLFEIRTQCPFNEPFGPPTALKFGPFK